LQKIKTGKALSLFNSNHLSNQKRRIILSKSGVEIKKGSNVMPPFFYEFGNIEIGSDVYINAGCVFLDNAAIKIGNKTLIGPNVTLTTVNHSVKPSERHEILKPEPIVIGNNVWLGAGVVVLPGISIGDNSVIAANSVVTQNVPENALYAGSPAAFKRQL